MLKDADPAYFAGIYIVCGYTDLRYGIDSLAAIIERKYHTNLFIPNTLFLFCGRSASKFQLNFCFSLCKTENFFLVSSQFSRCCAQHFLFSFSSFVCYLDIPIFHLLIHCHFCPFPFLLNCSFCSDSGIMVSVRRRNP